MKIHEDSWRFVRICKICENKLKLLNIGWICDVRLETNIFKSRFVNHNMKRIRIRFVKARIEPFLESEFVPMIQNKSMFLWISYTIPANFYSISIEFTIDPNWFLDVERINAWFFYSYTVDIFDHINQIIAVTKYLSYTKSNFETYLRLA